MGQAFGCCTGYDGPFRLAVRALGLRPVPEGEADVKLELTLSLQTYETPAAKQKEDRLVWDHPPAGSAWQLVGANLSQDSVGIRLLGLGKELPAMRLLNLQLREGDPAIRVVMVEGFAVELEVTLWLEEERLQMAAAVPHAKRPSHVGSLPHPPSDPDLPDRARARAFPDLPATAHPHPPQSPSGCTAPDGKDSSIHWSGYQAFSDTSASEDGQGRF